MRSKSKKYISRYDRLFAFYTFYTFYKVYKVLIFNSYTLNWL